MLDLKQAISGSMCTNMEYI